MHIVSSLYSAVQLPVPAGLHRGFVDSKMDRTGQDRTGQDRRDRTGQGRTGQDRTGQT